MSWLNREELVNMVDLSSALLLPSKIKTFGSVAFEAMARGRPVIVSKNAGINEWDTLGKNILQLEHEEALIKTIQSLIDMNYEAHPSLKQCSFIGKRISYKYSSAMS